MTICIEAFKKLKVLLLNFQVEVNSSLNLPG